MPSIKVSLYHTEFLALSILTACVLFTPTLYSVYSSLIGAFLFGILTIVKNSRIEKVSISALYLLLSIMILVGISLVNHSFSPLYPLMFTSLLVLYAYVRNSSVNYLYWCILMVALGVVQSLYGIGQYFSLWSNITAPSFRISDSFDNPAGFADFLVIVFPFSLYLIKRENSFLCFLGYVSILLIVLAVVLSFSRAGIISLFVVFAIWFFHTFNLKISIFVRYVMVVVVLMLLLSGLYFLKVESANGRFLIWNCSLQMIKDKPLLGFGFGGFSREYMLYQADYFVNHPQSKYTMLADIVKHPFNEFLLLFIEQGFVGVLLFSLFIFFLIKAYLRNKNTENFHLFLPLVGIAVFSLFSYAFNYPIIRVVTVFYIAFIMKDEINHITIPRKSVKFLKPVLVLFLLLLLSVSVKMFYAEYKWNTVAKRSLNGETKTVMPDYANLYKTMNKNGLFLYNYGAELNYIGEWKTSSKMMSECTHFYNDNDVQLILADNYQHLKQYDKAEKHLILAYNMIPNRFIPLYRLKLLYDVTGEKEKAIKIANRIIDMPIKIYSPEIEMIKREMNDFLHQNQSLGQQTGTRETQILTYNK